MSYRLDMPTRGKPKGEQRSCRWDRERGREDGLFGWGPDRACTVLSFGRASQTVFLFLLYECIYVATRK